MESLKKYYRVDRREIAFIRFILEAYNGIATLTTVEPKKGIVFLRIMHECESDVEALLKDLGKSIIIEPIDPE